ncbi:MAG: ABC transporter permease [Armatimonadota bacterium]
MKFGKELSIFLILMAVCMFTGYRNPNFFSQANILNTTKLIGIYGIFSIGMGFVIITGGIDLSVGSVFALLGVGLSMLLTEHQMNPWLAVLLVVFVGGLLGLVHGLLVTKAKLQSFIVTLCGLMIYRSLARTITNDGTRNFSDAPQAAWLRDYANGDWLGLPTTMWLLLVVMMIAFVVLHKSVYGIRLFATGQNEESARFAGLPTQKLVLSTYVICGLLAGVSGVLLSLYTGSVASSSHGNGYELYAVAACVLGGFSLKGGDGSIFGVVLATALLQVLRNMINMLQLPQPLEFTIIGGVILAGVLIDGAIRNRKKRISA